MENIAYFSSVTLISGSQHHCAILRNTKNWQKLQTVHTNSTQFFKKKMHFENKNKQSFAAKSMVSLTLDFLVTLVEKFKF